MDVYRLFIYSLLISGTVLSDNFARAKERQRLITYNPGDGKTSSNVRNPKQPFSKMMPWNKIFRPLLPSSKGSKSPRFINQNFYPRPLSKVNHDALLQDSPDLFERFVCPEGYRKRTAGDTEFCSPTKTEQELARTESQCADGQVLVGSRCIVEEHKTGLSTCQSGFVRFVSEGQVNCVDQVYLKNIKCVKGTRLNKTDSGWRCDPIPVYQQEYFLSSNVKSPFQQHQSMALTSGLKATKDDTSMPTCHDGKVAAMSQDGFICLDPVFPPSVCPENRVPSLSSGVIQCVPCPHGQTVSQTEDGVKCETLSKPMPEIPCPDGLQPVRTSVGRICQYIPTSNSIAASKCPQGQQLELVHGKMACIHDSVCPPGQIIVQSENGEKRCMTPNLTDESSCLQDEVYYEGACISIRLAEKFLHDSSIRLAEKFLHDSSIRLAEKFLHDSSIRLAEKFLHDSSIPCKHGHFLVVSKSGSICKSVTDARVIEPKGSMSCGPGAVLTQTLEGFRCLQGELPLRVIPSCENDYVIARLGKTYQCISQYDADLNCSDGEQMRVREDGGFACRKPVTEEYCGPDEVYHTDQDGRLVCLSVMEASEVCGDVYIALRKDKGFICKKRVEDVSCPPGFTLSMDHGKPVCIEEGVDCYGTTELTSDGCLNKDPYCQSGYKITLDLDLPHCELQLSTGFEKPLITDTGVRPCDADGFFRPCDLPAHLLLSGCNPDCANGGTCVNGSCLCPVGIKGHACHIDVNECQSHPCGYSCENTFGSYQCACPSGMLLNTDGRTCTDAGCIPDCLNGGECVRGQCRCTSGFEGKFCQSDKDECSMYRDRLCQHRCRNTYGGYTCICPPGSRLNPDGRTCLNTTCIPECRNGGVCRNHRCHCPNGFYGIICQFDVNECRRDKPCHQKCVNSWGSYSCSCNEGYVLQTDGRACVKA